ncbi:MAG: transcription-repair coupling factor [Lachnospiraceae bacterium]|jgi:transcription-repair coupling factor (superfamily II helicase)|nr:transcription-repair coupling factor [Lachnospiraceae bacterium]MCH4032139.1 transcription-repair coupling factor [Lachnospiraceae bacterium]MCH4108983.1 transcription-repair coupling factor [Lachnospiraceae bacterium]MCI1302262.1 transcription-repair coupling factor [Lachnospiraceae bacterium]MCI1332481.1 transcription-repair coupling factor [Lachnospiraceae bacterium]
MVRNAFLKPVQEMTGLKDLREIYRKRAVQALASGCIDTQKCEFVHAAAEDFPVRLFVTTGEVKARRFAEECRVYGSEAIYYPARDILFYAADTHGKQTEGERLAAIAQILDGFAGRRKDPRPLTVVTTIDALADLLPPPQKFEDSTVTIRRGQSVDPLALQEQLAANGYERAAMVESPGEMAVRGDIIDVFPFTEETPVRIEFFDDEVDSLRYFDVQSQRSIEMLTEIRLFPAKECLLDSDEIASGTAAVRKSAAEAEKRITDGKKGSLDESDLDRINHLRHLVDEMERTRSYGRFFPMFSAEPVSLLRFFDPEKTLVALDDAVRLKETMDGVYREFTESAKTRLLSGTMLAGQAGLLRSFEDISRELAGYRGLITATFDSQPEGFKIAAYVRADARSVSHYGNSFEDLKKDLTGYVQRKYTCIVACASRSRAVRLADDLDEAGLPALSGGTDAEVLPGHILVTYGNISGGYEYPMLRFLVIAESDIFTRKKERRRKAAAEKNGEALTSYQDLAVGDYVVHEDYGIGIYRGIVHISLGGVEKDYVRIEYAKGAAVQVPATQLDRLQKYTAADSARKPKVTDLGTSEWKRVKSRAKMSAEAVADDLVKLYAARLTKKGFAFGPDTEWQREFEEMFPYEETGDQLKAITDVKTDMESPRIMDRLICGDVGFGKTEIALRAAFKAVQDGKQVAMLAPTTILCDQHYNTFLQRMEHFPVRIAQLSSFRTAAQNKETVKALKDGTVDIVIGTHRLLSKDVTFRDLGLLVIDEEQRFGVRQKEKIKNLRANVDVLSLSATPIPRSLHMSLAGIRDMSVLEEPPVDRLPIQTFVTALNPDMIRDAIRRELGRGGQVYFVHNRVNNIVEVTDQVRALVPEANVVYAHGQMDKRQLEKIMEDFVNGEVDVLVSTTIIESGVDIGNCNTIIIDDATKLGLSQLYQLRGRVGRTSRTSYAFLFYSREKQVSDQAEKRLNAMREFSDLGSGYRLAMKDLEIRGAGDVLGTMQHGMTEAIGYDLYCKMLNTAVAKLKGEKIPYEFETRLALPVDAYMPENYIRTEAEKLTMYKRIARLTGMEELTALEDELTDRYGAVPAPARQLLLSALVKAKAHAVGVCEVKGKREGRYWITQLAFTPQTTPDTAKAQKAAAAFGGAVLFAPGKEGGIFVWRISESRAGNVQEYLQGLISMLERLTPLLA